MHLKSFATRSAFSAAKFLTDLGHRGQSAAEVMNLVMNAALGAGGEPEKRSAITGRVRVRVSKRRSSVYGAEI